MLSSYYRGFQAYSAESTFFLPNQLATIYGIQAPGSVPPPVTVGVLSFGGGIRGTVDASGVVTGGDVQQYWTNALGMSALPKVVLVLLSGGTNDVNGDGTVENTIDVQTIGGCFPSSTLTIILYITGPTLDYFPGALHSMLDNPVMVSGRALTPSIISISWGLAESLYPANLRTSINNYLGVAVSRGINVCVATGDFGANDKQSAPTCDFPASSPNVIACGGTTLSCPNLIYDSSTTEVAWRGGGGGISGVFAKPLYQQGLSGSFRHVPDVALLADPSTGVIFYINGGYAVVGGTSVSAPIMAAYLASLNMRADIHQKLYDASFQCFHDISTGNNLGYNAAVGYDECTGLGSINGTALKAQLPFGIICADVSLNLAAGAYVQEQYIVYPTGTPVTWSSSNPAVGTVDSSGLITAVGNGQCNIIAML